MKIKILVLFFFCIEWHVYAQSTLYVVNPDAGLESINLYASQKSTIVNWETNKMRCLAIDKKNRKIYWTDLISDKILRSNLDGTFIEDVIKNGLSLPQGIAIDTLHNFIFWLDNGTKTIMRSDINGSNVIKLFEFELINLNRIKVDEQHGKIYWTEWGDGAPFGKIIRANLDGTGREELIKIKNAFIQGIALDIPGGKMYWTDSAFNVIQKSNLDGSNIEDIITSGLSAPNSIDIDLNKKKIYWSELGNKSIKSANLDGTNTNTIKIRNLAAPQDIALYDRLLLDSKELNSVTYSISPNPVANRLHIYGIDDRHEISIIDGFGKTWIVSNERDIDVSQLSAGIYTCKIKNTSDRKSSTLRFFKI
jgi:Low-density lipoprotein receptor repeat class B/Secretion system C-terminal sorting domain